MKSVISDSPIQLRREENKENIEDELEKLKRTLELVKEQE
jgi:hypothetical protein